ncbi:MAG TPA: nucleoside triphosphate pyrophosphatase [Rhizomicrobium sp.]|nr:nucleoside triphosphate pyrophosphatase [Rhizomicrobium sp.]
MTCLVLASASTSRARVLSEAGVAFAVQPAQLDEDAVKASGMDAQAVAARLAEMKAQHVSASRPGDLVLGADQVLVCEGAILSKAQTLSDAAAQLKFLRGKTHTLVSALALARGGAVAWRHAEAARLRMRDFSDAFLDSYLKAEGEAVLGSVGCYRLEGPGAQLFDSVEGDYFSILGLPLLPLLAALREQGVIAR